MFMNPVVSRMVAGACEENFICSLESVLDCFPIMVTNTEWNVVLKLPFCRKYPTANVLSKILKLELGPLVVTLAGLNIVFQTLPPDSSRLCTQPLS